MEIKPKESKVVNPEPFFKVVFGCSNRAFYQVKNDIYRVAENIGIEAQDGYLGEKCDYEGDLEEITIYREERSEPLIAAVLEFYEIDKSALPDGMNLVLSIF